VKTLHLLRHAKSDWGDDSLTDHERPLAPRGVKAAGKLAEHLKREPIELDLVLCSTARRARETLELIRPSLGKVEVAIDDDLYGAGADEMIRRVKRVPARTEAVMLVGHNPGMEEVAGLLLGLDKAPGHFPTCALASLRILSRDWRSIKPGEAELIAFLTPKEI
jgi:phosphohistidine phosphatase